MDSAAALTSGSKRLYLFALSLALACSVSCATLRLERPTVELEALAVTGIGISGGSLNLVLDIYNPNAYRLRSRRIRAVLHLERTHFGDAELERPVELPARSHAQVELPLTFTWEGLGAGARGLLSRGSVRYALAGRMVVDTPAGERDVDLRTSGVVAVTDLVR